MEKTRLFTGDAAARWVNGEGKRGGKDPNVSLRWDAHERKVVDEGWKSVGGATKPTTQGKTHARKADEKIRGDTEKDDTEEDAESVKAPPAKRGRKAR